MVWKIQHTNTIIISGVAAPIDGNDFWNNFKLCCQSILRIDWCWSRNEKNDSLKIMVENDGKMEMQYWLLCVLFSNALPWKHETVWNLTQEELAFRHVMQMSRCCLIVRLQWLASIIISVENFSFNSDSSKNTRFFSDINKQNRKTQEEQNIMKKRKIEIDSESLWKFCNIKFEQFGWNHKIPLAVSNRWGSVSFVITEVVSNSSSIINLSPNQSNQIKSA